MKETEKQKRLEKVREKVRARIDEGRDPRIAHWQGALESLLVTVHDHLVAGEVITVESLKPDDIRQFRNLQITLDFSPFVNAVFLPPHLAEKFNPPEVAEDMGRSSEKSPSTKVVVSRLNDYNRILTAELSPAKPGIDIFDSGSLLGSYNYNTPEECISDLSKIIWIHLRDREVWQQADYINYTEGWFYRSACHNIPDLPINVNYSYIHHPVLIRLNTVAAIFKLMKATLLGMYADPDRIIAAANDARLSGAATEISREGLVRGDAEQKKALDLWLEDRLLSLLKLLQGYDIVNFNAFSESEQREFKTMFTRTMTDVLNKITEKISE
ncbi:hypothetical protein [Desulfonema ishimotonii]|nr:hypothetical protein [Desulfonema ishimotonii]